MRARLLVLIALLLQPMAARAVQPDEVMADPAMEARARALSSELRCLVCQNQSIDDSAAPLARDLRLLVRERIRAGDSDTAVKDYLVARYGDFVLLKPPFEPETLILWLTPFGVLVVGAAAILARRRAASSRRDAPLTAEEEARLHVLTGDRA